MTSGEFHSHIVKIAKRCQFPNPEAEERAIRDVIFLGMNSQRARDEAINLMNEEGKELTVEFLMNQLAVEECNAYHKSLSQLDSTSSMNFAAYDCRQNKGKSNKSKQASGGTRDRIILEHTDLQFTVINLENPQGWKESAWDVESQSTSQDRNAKCKDCHKIGHFHKVCQSKKRGKRANLVQTPPQDDDDTHINENGVRQPNPPRVNMLKIIILEPTEDHRESTLNSQLSHTQRDLQAPSSVQSGHRSWCKLHEWKDIQWTFSWSGASCMPPSDTEFRKLSCRHFNTGTVPYLLAV